MSSNPYFDPDADADILGGDAGGKHAVGGEYCGRCNKVHPIVDGLGPKELGDLSKMLDQLPDELVDAMLSELASKLNATKVPPHAEFLSAFFQAVDRSDYENQAGPILRAVAEAVDEMTGGAVASRIAMYECERQLITSFTMLKLLNNALEIARAQNAEGPLWMLAFACDFLVDRIQVVVGRYRKLCAEAGEQPDEQVITAGVYSDPSVITRATMVDLIRGTRKSQDD